MPTKQDLRSAGYSDEEIDNILGNKYAALIFGCELPGEAPQSLSDLTSDIG